MNSANLEYEYQYYGYNKSLVVDKMLQLGAVKQGRYLFRVMVFTPPNTRPNSYLRIRDERHRVTQTFKYRDEGCEFERELEVIIDDFDNGCNILLNIGHTKAHYYEKIREIWNLDDAEIIFDTMPGKPEEIMEIECHSLEKLNEIAIKLGFNTKSTQDREHYTFHYGIVMNHTDVAFETAETVLLPMATKNKDKLLELINYHKTLYYELKK